MRVLLTLCLLGVAQAFLVARRPLQLGVGASALAAKKEPQEEEEKKGITLQGLLELVSFGAGLPTLGKLKSVNFDDPSKPDLEFELEANNFMKETDAPYFEEGWVDDGREAGPGFWENLLSGGEKQREFDRKRKD